MRAAARDQEVEQVVGRGQEGTDSVSRGGGARSHDACVFAN